MNNNKLWLIPGNSRNKNNIIRAIYAQEEIGNLTEEVKK